MLRKEITLPHTSPLEFSTSGMLPLSSILHTSPGWTLANALDWMEPRSSVKERSAQLSPEDPIGLAGEEYSIEGKGLRLLMERSIYVDI